jgi:hypothetical protein
MLDVSFAGPGVVSAAWHESSAKSSRTLSPAVGGLLVRLWQCSEIPRAGEALLAYVIPLFYVDIQTFADFDAFHRHGTAQIAWLRARRNS